MTKKSARTTTLSGGGQQLPSLKKPRKKKEPQRFNLKPSSISKRCWHDRMDVRNGARVAGAVTVFEENPRRAFRYNLMD